MAEMKNTGGYWEQRKDYKYYKAVRQCIEDYPGHSILDVGSYDTPVCTWGEFTRRIAIDLNKLPNIKGVESRRMDYLKIKLSNKVDVITCLQVLEHLSDQDVRQCAKKLLKEGKIIIVTVPYKWAAGREEGHIQDPIDMMKVLDWFKVDPIKTELIVEENMLRRMLFIFKGIK